MEGLSALRDTFLPLLHILPVPHTTSLLAHMYTNYFVER